MIHNVQALRCIAALMVVWHHLQIRMNLAMDWTALEYVGRAGVDIFFVISGFIMFHTTQNGDRSIGRFWIDRVIRIVPMYWAVTGLVLVLFLLVLRPLEVRAVSAGDVLADLALLPNTRLDGETYPLLDVGWTLIYEMYFYALFGLTFALRSQAIALVALSVMFVAGAVLRTLTPLPHVFDFYFQPITLEFAAGGALALLYRRDLTLTRNEACYLGLSLLVCGAVLLFVNAAAYGEYVNWNFTLRAMVFGAPALLLVAGAVLLEKAGMAARYAPLMTLGAASYAIYLIHPLALQYGVEALDDRWPMRGPGEIVVIAVLAFTVAVAAGLAVHILFEKPVTRALHALSGRRRRPAGNTGAAPAA